MLGYRHPERGGGDVGRTAMLGVAAVIAITASSSFLQSLPVASGAAVSSLRTTRTSRTLQASTAQQDDHRSRRVSVAATQQLDDSDPWCVNCSLHRCSQDERGVCAPFIFLLSEGCLGFCCYAHGCLNVKMMIRAGCLHEAYRLCSVHTSGNINSIAVLFVPLIIPPSRGSLCCDILLVTMKINMRQVIH